jgi:CheY-like chemotaxis protein
MTLDTTISTVSVPTILVVDDYIDSLQVWNMYLSGAGFNVLTADNGPSALEQAITHQPDLIVLDLELPGLSGFEVARALRANDRTLRIPMIAATGYSQVKQLDEALQCGIDAVVVKPCEPRQLVAEIRRLLGMPATD